MMNNTQKKEILSQIKKEIEHTKNKIKTYKEMCKPIAPENAIGRISRMDAINNKSVNEAVLREAEKKIKQLQFMNKNINYPEFGECAKCKNTIPFGRLLIMPQSKYCVECAK